MVKKISKWSKLGISTGAIYIAISIVQWKFMHPDMDKLLSNIAIGILIAAVSWLHWENMDKNNRLTAIEDYLSEKVK